MESSLTSDVEATRIFIIGFAKCATTSLDEWLNSQPGISCSRPKEPHWFATDLDHTILRNELEYEKTFVKNRVLVDTSVWYIYSSEAVDNILKLYPNARFIIVYRPVKEFIQSVHSQMLFTGYEAERSLNKALFRKIDSVNGRFRKTAKLKEPRLIDYTAQSDMSTQIKRVVRKVDKRSLIILSMDRLINDTNMVLNELFRFLELEITCSEESLPRMNTRKIRRISFLPQIEYGINKLYQSIGIKGLGTGFWEYLDRINRKTKLVESREGQLNSRSLEYLSHRQEELNKIINYLDDNNWNILR